MTNLALVVPMANEEKTFQSFVSSLAEVLNLIQCGIVYIVLDNASKDNTLKLCKDLSVRDNRFVTVWSPENRNFVDAYIRGYKEALNNGADVIIEMDAGLSHDPKAIPLFLRALNEGYECAFGSRFIKGGVISDSNWKRTFLSKSGTITSNFLLGTKMHDMTSGFQGFQADVVRRFVDYELLSKAHFYQTELRYLLRERHFVEIPIHYKSPSPSISKKTIFNSLYVLFHYFILRLKFKPQIL